MTKQLMGLSMVMLRDPDVTPELRAIAEGMAQVSLQRQIEERGAVPLDDEVTTVWTEDEEWQLKVGADGEPLVDEDDRFILDYDAPKLLLWRLTVERGVEVKD